MSIRGLNHTTREDPLGLTWAERQLYDVLVDAGEETVRARELARRTWASTIILDTDENLVRQHILNIRKKLGAGAIEQHRGRGYRLAQARPPARRRAAS